MDTFLFIQRQDKTIIQIFISTSDKLDVNELGLRPHTITANIVVGLDEYLLNIKATADRGKKNKDSTQSKIAGLIKKRTTLVIEVLFLV